MPYRVEQIQPSRLVFTFALLLLIALLTIGCQRKEKISEPITLKIAGMWSGHYEFYKPLLAEKFPNIQFEVVDGLPDKALTRDDIERFIQVDEPDIIMTTFFTYRQVAKSGLVVTLDPLLQKDSMLSRVNGNVLQRLRNYSEEQQIYGWPLDFNSTAIFYNKNLFNLYQIPFPEGNISWGTILKLADRFPTTDTSGERLYGYYDDVERKDEEKIESYIESAGIAEQLTLYNKSALTIDTKEWLDIWTDVLSGYNKGSVDTIPQAEDLLEHPETASADYYQAFLDGHAAMVVGSPTLIQLLREQAVSFGWGITDMPGRYGDYSINDDIYSISQSSAHKEESLAVIEFLTGDDLVREMRASNIHMNIPLNVKILEEELQTDLSPFYRKEPASSDSWDWRGPFYDVYREEAIKQIRSILDGDKDAEQALSHLQQWMVPWWKQLHEQE